MTKPAQTIEQGKTITTANHKKIWHSRAGSENRHL